ncbi:MAG TPA: hypothetical protein DCZ00_01970 [Lactococcus sp.]|uniref:DUF4176 domain-containing protein n=1 Tax=Lactococcus TaxID=1357 RepID=UPI000E8864BC|nr:MULTISPECIES: DUF4176 domain-containing protein [Lactococcus]MBL3715967.1 DUF4176 domain-containing protein [Lactococcus garvieae]HAP14669.1 hypothetical protein [Lactococcus sp.]HBC90194.1 hypothetical protein [Lactococcus sp.]
MSENAKKLQFLGLGSVVEIDHMDALADTLYVIVARAVGKDSSGETILRYQVAPHPQGGSARQADAIITLAESDITKIVYEGYRDEKDDKFLSDMIAGMEKAIKKMGSSPKATAIPQEKKEEKPVVSEPPKVEDEKELLKRDPFYKFKK